MKQTSASDILTLEELIRSSLASIERTKEELKKEKEMLESAFGKDAVYHEHEEKVKEAQKIKLETQRQIKKTPQIMSISEKTKALREDLKEQERTLSEYAAQYQRLTDATVIEAENEIYDIINEVKLVKRKSKNEKPGA